MATELTLEQATGQRMLVAFPGYEPPAHFLDLLKARHVGGLTLFRGYNVQSPEQVRALTGAVQQAAAASGQPPLLIGADQEGGTLHALVGATRFPGNMALGATRSPDLARKAGVAIGRELAAMGVNINYAPVCDVQSNQNNPVIGVRSFGENPALVAEMASAMVQGLQQAGVAASAKHFPGHGDTATDSHYSTPILPFDLDRLRRTELPPFAAAIKAGTKLIMTAHIALPAVSGGLDVPATLSPDILKGLLRSELGYEGVIVSDALNMRAIQQGPGLVIDTLTAAAAGVDLLMLVETPEVLDTLYSALLQAARRGLLKQDEVLASGGRIVALKEWVGSQEQPDLSVVNSAEHQALSYEIASRACTLVRDNRGLLPLKLAGDARILAVLPRPVDLTPADTSSHEMPPLTEALRRYYPSVDEAVVPMNPTQADITALRERAGGYDLIVVGTINAFNQRGQGEMVNALVQTGVPTVAVAMRLPYDIAAYPSVSTYVCTYGIQPPSMNALADALCGHIPFSGKLPVTIAQQ